MKSLLRRHFIGAIISVLVLVVALAALYLFASKMRAREGRVIDARDRLASFEQNKRIFESEAKELQEIKNRIETLEANILTNESIPPLLSSLETMAKARAVDFTLTAVENSPAGEGVVPRLHIDFSATGTFANLESLAKDILSQTYQARFSRFSLYLQQSSVVDAKGKALGAKWQLLAGLDITSF